MNNLTRIAGQGQAEPTQPQAAGSADLDPTHDAVLAVQMTPIVLGGVDRPAGLAATILEAVKARPDSDDERDAYGCALRLALEHAVTPPAAATPTVAREGSRDTALQSPTITRQQKAFLATLGTRGEPTEAQFVKLRHIVGVVT